jgi:hypothetical protein
MFSGACTASLGHEEDARRVLAALPDGVYKRQASRGMAEAKPLGTRNYFP